jgi:ComEC/Rec2-related protein
MTLILVCGAALIGIAVTDVTRPMAVAPLLFGALPAAAAVPLAWRQPFWRTTAMVACALALGLARGSATDVPISPVGPAAWGAGLVAALAPVREAARLGIVGSLPEPQASLAAGVLLGGSGHLDPAFRVELQRSGLAHLVAIDGYKEVVVAAAISMLATRILGANLAVLPGLTAIAGYTLISGAHPSAVRAALMVGLARVASVGGRLADPLTSLGVATLGMALVDPRVLLDVGLQLSVSATLGIVLLWPVLRRWLRLRLLRRPIGEPLGLTLSVTLGCLPITLSTFEVVSLVSPLAHVVAVPLLPVVLLSAAVLAVAAALPLPSTSQLTSGLLALIILSPPATITLAPPLSLAVWLGWLPRASAVPPLPLPPPLLPGLSWLPLLPSILTLFSMPPLLPVTSLASALASLSRPWTLPLLSVLSALSAISPLSVLQSLSLPSTLLLLPLTSSPPLRLAALPALAVLPRSAATLPGTVPLPSLVSLAAWLAWLPASLLAATIHLFGSLPGAAVTTGRLPPVAALGLATALLGCGVWHLPECAGPRRAWSYWWSRHAAMRMPASTLAACCAALTLLTMMRPDGKLSIAPLPLSRGEAIFVRGPTGQTALVVRGSADGRALAQDVADHLAVFEHKLDRVIVLDPGAEKSLGLTLARYPADQLTRAPAGAQLDLGAGQLLTVASTGGRLAVSVAPAETRPTSGLTTSAARP